MRIRSTHRKEIEKLFSSPHEIGIENVIASSIEPQLYDGSGRLVAEPDLVFYCSNGDVYVVEYKSNGDSTSIAVNQLYNAVRWFNSQGIYPKTMIIEGRHQKRKIIRPNPVKRDFRHYRR